MKNYWIALFVLLVTTTFSGCAKKTPAKTFYASSTISVALTEDPETLDPRVSRSLDSSSIQLALFEGLYVTTAKGTVPGVAITADVSADGKTYTFKLRESQWSNGEAVTAHDFEYTWKKILSPDFPAPQANLLFPLKNGRLAKLGNISVEDVGVRAIDDHTLQVELHQPDPHFLELVGTRAFLPVSKKVDEENPKWAEKGPKHFVCNGPYKLARWKYNDEVYLEKSPTYWKVDQIRLPGIRFVVGQSSTALDLFLQGNLDWAGSPLSTLPTEALATLEDQQRLYRVPAAAVFWIRVNTTKNPLSSTKVRRALAYALNRRALTQHVLRSGQQPALSIVPSMHRQPAMTLFPDNTPHRAREALEEGLQELGLTRETIPEITLLYSSEETRHQVAQALQQQWQEVLGIPIKLQRIEGKVVLSKLRHLDYDIAIGNWYADVEDPLNFLDVFRSEKNGVNNTGWENALYTSLLGRAERELNSEKRDVLYRQAERVLIREMPCIPLFFATLTYAKSDRVRDVHVSSLGVMDFRHAWVKGSIHQASTRS